MSRIYTDIARPVVLPELGRQGRARPIVQSSSDQIENGLGKAGRGSPRALVEVVEQGEHVSRKRVIRLMQAAGLKARIRRRYRPTTVEEASAKVG